MEVVLVLDNLSPLSLVPGGLLPLLEVALHPESAVVFDHLGPIALGPHLLLLNSHKRLVKCSSHFLL